MLNAITESGRAAAKGRGLDHGDAASVRSRILSEGQRAFKENFQRDALRTRKQDYIRLADHLRSPGSKEALIAANTFIAMENQKRYWDGLSPTQKLMAESTITSALGPIAPRIIDVVRIENC